MSIPMLKTYDPQYPEALQHPPNMDPRQVTPLPHLPSWLTPDVVEDWANEDVANATAIRYAGNIAGF